MTQRYGGIVGKDYDAAKQTTTTFTSNGIFTPHTTQDVSFLCVGGGGGGSGADAGSGGGGAGAGGAVGVDSRRWRDCLHRFERDQPVRAYSDLWRGN